MDEFKILIGKGYDWETFVYIFQDLEGFKFGITNSIERRQKQYEKDRPTLKLKYCKPFSNRNIARFIEYHMKSKFPIIKGLETTNANLEELINFIETFTIRAEDFNINPPYIKKNEENQNSISSKNERRKSYTIEDKRLENVNAYMKWTKEDDEKLEALFSEGKNIIELSEIFGRKNSAIKSRINKSTIT